MKKCVLCLICVLYAYSVCGQNWWESQFTIGTHSNPPLMEDVDISQSRDFQTMMDLGINFTIGNRYPNNCRDNVYDETVYSQYIPIRYLLPYHSNSLDNVYPANCGGFRIQDEPEIEDSTQFKSKVGLVKQHQPNMLGFINLFPKYKYEGSHSWASYLSYVEAYVADTTLQVVSFDNYYPHSFFQSFSASHERAYFPNLALLRRLSGNRPLWSYVKCWEENFVRKDSIWKDAYLSLSAFAPIAFGAKGILYYTYTGCARNLIWRDKGKGWAGNYLHFNNDEQNREVFFGHFRENSNGYMDLAVKTDENIGSWHIKCAEDTAYYRRHDWTKVLTWYGDFQSTRAFVADWDLDGLDELLAIRYDGYLFVSDSLSSWKYRIPLDGYPRRYHPSMKKGMQLVADFQSNLKPDICLAWNEDTIGKVRIYRDIELNHPFIIENTPIYGVDTLTNYFDLLFPGEKILQLLSRNDTLFVFSSNYTNCNKLSGFRIGDDHSVENVISLELKNNNGQSHYWLTEGAPSFVYGQCADGKVRYWDILDTLGNDYIDNGHVSMLLHVEGHDSCSNIASSAGQKKMYYYATISDVYESGIPAIVDEEGQPTSIYSIIKRINNFISNTLAPVVMNNNYVGTYFVSYPNRDNYVLAQEPLISLLCDQDIVSELSDSLMVGIFENPIHNYFVIVNLTDRVITSPHITFKTSAFLKPSMKEEKEPLLEKYISPVILGRSSFIADNHPIISSSIKGVTFSWNQIRPGECILIRKLKNINSELFI